MVSLTAVPGSVSLPGVPLMTAIVPAFPFGAMSRQPIAGSAHEVTERFAANVLAALTFIACES